MGHGMEVVAKLDEIGKPAWIGVTILAFVLFWPFGLGLLIYLFWSGRMGCGKRGMNGMHKARGRWYSPCGGSRWQRNASSGNSAFDEYKAETLRRLEDEQNEFVDFLDRLRQAKDKAEFDQFMADRRKGSQGTAEGPEAQPQG